jgi:peptidyl-prolyl cis-trans isomerase B (cyclophilin B)
MNPITRFFVPAALAAALFAQTQTQDKAADPAISARLKPVREVVAALGEVEVTLIVEVKRDTTLDPTVLSGTNLTVKVNDKEGKPIVQKVPGELKVSGGLRIERTFKFQAPDVPETGGKLALVTISWPDLPGATTTVRVAPDPGKIDLAKLDYAKTQVVLLTNFGEMTVGFRHDKAPKHVENFIKLSKEGFYNGTKFHRVVKNFMIQGGCPNTREGAKGMPGTGNPGYTVNAEFNDIRHERGVLSMARSSDPNSAGSQFFVLHGTAPHLDQQYSAFGQLVSGLETLDRIANIPVRQQPQGEMSAPTEPVHLYQAIVLPAFKQ